jgi:hypothetical protein
MACRDLGRVRAVDRHLDADGAELLLQHRRDQRQFGPVRIGDQRQGEALAIALEHAVRARRPAEPGQQRLRAASGSWASGSIASLCQAPMAGGNS